MRFDFIRQQMKAYPVTVSRQWRKDKVAQEAVPVYTIFTNEQLAQIVEKNVTTKEGLQQIDGIGQGRVKKYGNDVINIVTQPSQGMGLLRRIRKYQGFYYSYN